MNWKSSDQSSYLVEVSGWGHLENFFVESSMMEWASEGKRKVNLGNTIRQGTIVLIRLCQPLWPDYNLPVAFQVKAIGSASEQKRAVFTLVQLHPRGHRQNSQSRSISIREEIAAV